jgi:hypothetical protein
MGRVFALVFVRPSGAPRIPERIARDEVGTSLRFGPKA